MSQVKPGLKHSLRFLMVYEYVCTTWFSAFTVSSDSACLIKIFLASSSISHASCKFDGSSSSSFSTSFKSPWSWAALVSLSSEPIVSFSAFSFSSSSGDPSWCASSCASSGTSSSSSSVLFSSDSISQS